MNSKQFNQCKRKQKSLKIKSKVLRINVEKILFVSFIIFFTVLIVAQIALTKPTIMVEMTMDTGIEGVPLKSEEFLYSYGELTLKLIGNCFGQDVKILVNGDEKDSFLNREKTIKVKNGDVIEIDGTEINDYIDVIIVSKSDNIKTNCLGQKFRIKSEVKKIIKVKIE